MAAGGQISQERADVCHYLEDMEILADVMEAQGHWRKPQVLESHLALLYSSPGCTRVLAVL